MKIIVFILSLLACVLPCASETEELDFYFDHWAEVYRVDPHGAVAMKKMLQHRDDIREGVMAARSDLADGVIKIFMDADVDSLVAKLHAEEAAKENIEVLLASDAPNEAFRFGYSSEVDRMKMVIGLDAKVTAAAGRAFSRYKAQTGKESMSLGGSLGHPNQIAPNGPAELELIKRLEAIDGDENILIASYLLIFIIGVIAGAAGLFLFSKLPACHN